MGSTIHWASRKIIVQDFRLLNNTEHLPRKYKGLLCKDLYFVQLRNL
jgi:hypothetical protein